MTFEQRKESLNKILDRTEELLTDYRKNIELVELTKDACGTLGVKVDYDRFEELWKEYNLVRGLVHKCNWVVIRELFTSEEVSSLEKEWEDARVAREEERKKEK